MTLIKQIVGVSCVPIAMTIFLFAAQVSGGLVLRDAPITQIALK